MRTASQMDFGFVAAPADVHGTPDRALMDGVLKTCEMNRSHGFRDVWVLEHHFTDWYPTPDPMLLLTRIATSFPDLRLGTSVVVLPWHQPIRLAEQLAMLTHLSDQQLRIGVGRGNAPLEYEGFGLEMEESRERFSESLELLRLALAGEPFEFDGKHHQVRRPVTLTPKAAPGRIRFFGAATSADTARVMGGLGIEPMFVLIGRSTVDQQAALIDDWASAARASGHNREDPMIPILGGCMLADTDEEAIALAEYYVPPFITAQIAHYEADSFAWENVPSFAAWRKTYEGIRRLTQPENIREWAEGQLIGSPATVRDRIAALRAAGFNYLILRFPMIGVPLDQQLEWARRFAEDVAPEFSNAFGRDDAGGLDMEATLVQ